MDCGGHFSVNGTFKKVSTRYWWPSMAKDVENYVKTCEKCQFRSRYQNEEPLQIPPVPTLFSKWGMDLVGPLPRSKSGFQYMIFATDYFSGWVCGRRLRLQTAKAVAKFVYEEVITKHGCPKEIVTDQGSQFMADVFAVLLKIMSVKHRKSAAYNPQVNGRAERTNKIIVDTMSKLAVEYKRNWEEVFDAAMWAYNTTVIRGRKHSPFFLKYGVEARLPIDFSIRNELDQPEDLEDRIKKLMKLQETRGQVMELLRMQYVKRQKQREGHGRLRKTPLQEGTLVLRYKNPVELQEAGKMGIFWEGPFEINEAYGNGAYKLELPDGILDKTATAGRRLKEFHIRSDIESHDKHY